MKLSSILCPVDFSPNAAIDFASRLAKSTGAILHFLFVEESLTPYGIGIHGQLPSPVTRDAMMIERIKPTVEGVSCDRHVVLGIPAAEILSFAEARDIDVIVMGTHGRIGASRVLMGSVAEKVVRHAPCAVITVKQQQRNAEAPDTNDPNANDPVKSLKAS